MARIGSSLGSSTREAQLSLSQRRHRAVCSQALCQEISAPHGEGESMSWIAICLIVYSAGFVFTLIFNAMILVYISNPLAILRNALLWPIFLPYLVITWIEEG
jgi:hypothetical protein